MGFSDNIKDLLTLKKAVKNQRVILTEVEKSCNEAESKRNEIIQKIKSSQTEYDQIISRAKSDAQHAIQTETQEIAEKGQTIQRMEDAVKSLSILIEEKQSQVADIDRRSENQKKKIKRALELIKSIEKANEEFSLYGVTEEIKSLEAEIIQMEPSIILKTPGENLQDIRKNKASNNKLIEDLLKTYRARYTTKTNAALYSLLVIALKAELQNAVISLRYDKLDIAIDGIKAMTKKYLILVTEGNQSIAPTMTRFIGQIEYLFFEAVKIEYEYYVKQEQIREEQRAIREQLRQEAEERKILEQQKKQLEAEEAKYLNEIASVEALLESTIDPDKQKIYENKIQELRDLVNQLEDKKDDIIKLQNGQAGNIYIISNLGSFGDQVFKIGMTRRLQPMDRINELGDASVPFSFDVHAMIFSDNAVTLENKLHQEFSSRRLNKINNRKEFFRLSVDELQSYVNIIEPSAEFNTTMLAEQYRLTLAIDEGIIELTEVTEETTDNNNSDEHDDAE